MKKTETQATNSINKKLKRIIIIIFILFFILIASAGVFVIVCLAPVDSKSDGSVEFALEKGWGVNKIADELEKNNLIKNAFVLKV